MSLRFGAYVLALATISVVLVPTFAHAEALIPFFGPIIPKLSLACPFGLGWGALIVVINNIIRLLLTLAIVLVAPLMIAWSGFILVANPFNPGAKEKAKSMLLNLAIGIVIALAAWMLVDALMAVIYRPSGLSSSFGTRWSAIISSGGQGLCLEQAVVPTGTFPSGGVEVQSNVPLVQNPRNGCTQQDLASAWGSNAASMSCVTVYENSTCDPNIPSSTDKGSDGKAVSWGIYQVNISADDLNYPECTAGGTPLNCTKAFNCTTKNTNGSCAYTSSNHTTYVQDNAAYNRCVKAVTNVACNTAAAKKIFNTRVAQGNNPLTAWGDNARRNCSTKVSFLTWEPLAGVLSALDRFFTYEY